MRKFARSLVLAMLMLLTMTAVGPAPLDSGDGRVATECESNEATKKRRPERIQVSYRMPPNLYQKARSLIYEKEMFSSYSDLINQAVTRLIDDITQESKFSLSTRSNHRTNLDNTVSPTDMNPELVKYLKAEMRKICNDVMREHGL